MDLFFSNGQLDKLAYTNEPTNAGSLQIALTRTFSLLQLVTAHHNMNCTPTPANQRAPCRTPTYIPHFSSLLSHTNSLSLNHIHSHLIHRALFRHVSHPGSLFNPTFVSKHMRPLCSAAKEVL